MLTVALEETILTKKKNIPLTGITKIEFENLGGHSITIGIKKLMPSEKRVISTDGAVFMDGYLNIIFPVNLPGKLYMQTHRVRNCNKN
jgi:hypothetical protein